MESLPAPDRGNLFNRLEKEQNDRSQLVKNGKGLPSQRFQKLHGLPSFRCNLIHMNVPIYKSELDIRWRLRASAAVTVIQNCWPIGYMGL